jgi:hypothetical protein
MVYDTQNKLFSGLCPLSKILILRKHNASETVSVSIHKWGGGQEMPNLLGLTAHWPAEQPETRNFQGRLQHGSRYFKIIFNYACYFSSLYWIYLKFTVNTFAWELLFPRHNFIWCKYLWILTVHSSRGFIWTSCEEETCREVFLLVSCSWWRQPICCQPFNSLCITG